jgi:hypothetical protein
MLFYWHESTARKKYLMDIRNVPLTLTQARIGPLAAASSLGRPAIVASDAERSGGTQVAVNGLLAVGGGVDVGIGHGRGGKGIAGRGQSSRPLSLVKPLDCPSASANSLDSTSSKHLSQNRQVQLPDVDLSLWTNPDYWRAQGHQNWDNISQEDDYCEHDYDGDQKWGETAEESIKLYLERRPSVGGD